MCMRSVSNAMHLRFSMSTSRPGWVLPLSDIETKRGCDRVDADADGAQIEFVLSLLRIVKSMREVLRSG
jgi:hypothetical protein